MFIEIDSDLTFSFEKVHTFHVLTIWEDGGGFIEVKMSGKELQELRDAIR